MRNNNRIMEFSTHRRSFYWLLGLCLLLLETTSTDAQGKRASRIANSRSFGSSVKTSTSNGLNFDCPEEFGYYPHPTDCTQYYVCVFGGALLESCTGGLMYSHELQTCDWPRNVGCELVDSGTSATSTELGSASRSKVQQQQKHQQQQHQHVPSRIRFGSAFTSPAATQKAPTVPPQYNRSPPQIIQAQVQHIPPPPELRVPPNPVVMSRGQPKSLLESQEQIAKLYAEAQETLPPVEEEESDRQQRVYRGQPSTVSQVQRDRDGIIHQASINAIPSHGKIGSYTFGTAYSESFDDDIPIGLELSHNRLDLDRRRKRRAANGVKFPTTTTDSEVIKTSTEKNSDSNSSSEVLEPENTSNESMNSSYNSEEQIDVPSSTVTLPHKYVSEINQKDIKSTSEDDADCIQINDDIGDNTAGESMRRPRQLRPFPYTSSKWAGQNFRSIDTPSSVHHLNAPKNGYSFGNYNPYLTPSVQQNLNNQNYNQLSPIPTFKPYIQQHIPQQQQPTFVYTGYNLSLPPPPIEDDFRPITGNYYGAASLTSPRPQVNYQDPKNPGDLLPYIIQQLKEVKERRKQIQTENFAYFHLDNQPIAPPTTPRSPFDYYSTSKPIQQVTPNGNNVQHSTMGGFYNNKPDHASGKLISQYSISQSPESQGTTESNYFQYNIIANQKMKGIYNTAKQNQIDHAIKLRPPVTPVQVTPNFNIVSAPNLGFNKPEILQQTPSRDLLQLPVGISYASNNTLPESYQTFTKSISSTAVPKLPSTTTKKQEPTNFQFNINEFMANLKASDLASFNPAVNPLIKYFKQVSNDGSGNVRNTLVLRRPVTYTSTNTTTIRPALRTKPIQANQPNSTSTTRVPKGYEGFVKSIQSKNSTGIPRLTNGYTSTTTTDKSVEYYDDEYDDGIDEDMLPPSRMPPYMPMSETMSPPRPHITTARPTTAKPSSMRPYTQTGFMSATTTRRPFSNFAQLKQSNQGSSVPAFISFPSDIFQELRQRLPQLKPSAATENPTIHVRVQSTTTMKTTSSPESTRFTARPQRTRGQHKWQTQVMDNLHPGSDRPQNETNRGSKSSVSADGLGGLHLNSIHINSSAERQRVESSSPSSQLAQTSDNIFVPPSSQAPPPQLASNRNYYNASIYNHGVGYQTQQQAQIQQQPTPFQQPQQQQQEATALPNPYDSSYYSVYDDDVDLYRDIDYQQQQEQQQQQHQQQVQQQVQQQQQEYQPNIRQQQQQSTYRPLEILTTPAPVQRPTYNAQPVLSYSTDYDEDLNAQIEHDNVYEQPTPTPRREEVTIQTLEAQIAATTTLRPSVRHDVRNYYHTLPTPNSSSEETDYTYSTSSEDYYESESTSGKNDIKTQPKPVNLDEFNLNANDVAQSSTPSKVGQYEKYPSTTIWTTTSPSRSSSVSSKYTTKALTTTTTITTTTTQPTKLPLLSSKTHVNNKFKPNVIIKLKTTTKIPRPTQAPSTRTTFSTTSTPIPPLVPTYNSNPFLKSKLQVLAKSLVQAVSLRESQSQVENGNNETTKTSQIQVQPTLSLLLPSTSEQWSLVDDSANRSTPSVETIYDESQNVHIKALEIPSTRSISPSSSAKFLDFINAAAYGNNNFARTSTEKFLREDNKYNGIQREPFGSTEKNQSQRIQSYVESDVKPQSFKATTGSRHMPGTASEESLDSSSTTRPNNVYHYSLQSGSHGFALKAQQSLNMDNASEPLIQRVDTWNQVKPNTTTTTTTQKTTRSPHTQVSTNTEQYENILPTTYAPLRVWRNGRPTIKQAPVKVTTAATLVTEVARDVNSSTTRASIAISNFTTSTERAIHSQSFTARANLFKDNLNRVTSNPSVRFVSPYKSLESLLQDERDKGSHNNLRVTARSRYASGLVIPPLLQTTPKSTKNIVPVGTLQKNISQSVFATMATGNVRNFSISDAILSTFSPQRTVASTTIRTTTTSSSSSTSSTASTTITTVSVPTTNIIQPTVSTIVTTSPIHVSDIPPRPRGRSRYTAATISYNLDGVDEPTTYAPKFKIPNNFEVKTTTFSPYPRRKMHRGRVANSIRQTLSGLSTNSEKKYNDYKEPLQPKEINVSIQKLATSTPTRNPIENEASIVELEHKPRAEALIAQHPFQAKQDNSIELNFSTETTASSSSEMIITDRPPVKYLFSNKYRQQTAEHTLAESLQNAGYLKTGYGRSRFQTSNVLEQLQHFLSASDSDESGSPQFVDEVSAPEVKSVVNEIKQKYITANRNATIPTTTMTSTTSTTTMQVLLPTTIPAHTTAKPRGNSSKFDSHLSILSVLGTDPTIQNSSSSYYSTTTPVTTLSSSSVATSPLFVPPTTRVSRVNNALKSSIAAAVVQSSSPGSTSSTSTYHIPGGRAKQFQYGFASNNNNNNQHQFNNNNAAVSAASVKCSDSTLNAKCNEIPSRNNNRNRGNTIYSSQDRDSVSTSNRGTHPPRLRPTLKPSGTIVSKAQEFVDIYKYPPSRPEPLYPQPTPDKTAAKCRKDVCLLPDCYCGGKDIPGELPVESIPQIVLLTFDDSVNDLNKQLYMDLFEKGRVNPNGCPITATFYVSHEWTDYSQVQNLYADGHEMASHTVSHSFGEQFSQKKWTREIAGQREILAAYGGVKLSDVRGMRAPFLSVGGNKMYKMLYDSNFTYDSSMPVYENRPPSWPYTLDYKIFHDCMIPPCPTRSYPGVWQVPMVMWQDLNGGRCSMGDACSNPSDAEGVTKMIMKNFERHYTTNRAPFGLFYHAAWFTQPHHKEGFIKFLDAINAMQDVWIITNWQALQWVRDPTPTSRINSFQPFQCDYSDRPKRCNNPKVCNLWHKSGVRYMKTCQPCPDIYPWTGKSGIRSSRIDNEVEEPQA